MNNKKTYVATFWRSNPQVKNGGYYTTREFEATTKEQAEKQVKKYMKDTVYGGLSFIGIALKQKDSI